MSRSLWPGIDPPTTRPRRPAGIDWRRHCTPFVLRSQYVLFGMPVLAHLISQWNQWPLLKLAVAPFSLWNPLTCPVLPPMNYARSAKCRGDHMDDRSRLAAAWSLTFVLCVGL